jgi:phospholipid/cholesterol/gamma-HCH transport system permease protein
VPDVNAVAASAGGIDSAGAVRIVPDGLTDWDSSLLTFLYELVRRCEAQDVPVDLDALPDDLRRLVDLSQAVPEASAGSADAPSSLLERFGEWIGRQGDGVVAFATFTGRSVQSAGRLLRGRGRMRGRDFWLLTQRTSADALPIVTLISFLVGLILSFLGAVVLRRFGADYYVSYLVSYGVLRELGALMTAIIMAGRTGAAFAAELGSMKVSEEIDALRTLGISPVDFLVMPRLLAVFVALPLLTLYANAVGIVGGWTVAISMLDVTSAQFFTGLLTPITLADAVLGLVKAVVFGAIIGLAGCLRGLQTGSDATAVGDAATSAVVTGITLIVAANAVLDWMAAVLDV